MRASWRAADRVDEVRRAARDWRAAGLVGDAALSAIDEEYPAPGPRLGSAWRALVFVCVGVGACAATLFGLFTFGMRDGASVAAVLIVSGAALALLTDVVIERSSWRPTGAEAATSLLAVSYLIGAAFVLGDHFHLRGTAALGPAFAWSAAVLGLAAWRWGFSAYAGASVAAALLAAAQLPGGRLAWIAAAAIAASGAGALVGRCDLTPSHRRGLALARIVALAGIYVAVNYLSVDKGILEEIGRAAGAPRHRPGADALWLAWAASALYPPTVLAWGLRARDRALVDLGAVSAVLSLATARHYAAYPPLWLTLVAGGAALAGTSLLLGHWLHRGRGGERAGFTGAPLEGETRRGRLLPVAAAVVASPGAQAPPGERQGTHGAGGGFGGGGAAGGY